MFDDDTPKKQTADFPRNLDTMSVVEIADYIKDLQAEINRAQADSDKKQLSMSAADSVFK